MGGDGRDNQSMSYIDVGGMRVWHEVHGDGDPVVLLHGGFAGADSWFAQVPALVDAGYRVYVPERRGHAHTPDVEGPISYQLMATDTIAYLAAVVDGPAHLVGWSDGAVVALLIAMSRPDLLDRLVLIGQYYNSSGQVPGGLIEVLMADLDATMSFLRPGYDPISPDGPDHFPIVFAKMLAMVQSEPELDLADLVVVAAPTLVVQGDRDDVSVHHSVAVVAALANARLAVLPGSHALPIESPGLVNPLIVSWLAGGPPSPPWEAPAPLDRP
jgi:pimeloyl-ACP methyl ester carboxylesterase